MLPCEKLSSFGLTACIAWPPLRLIKLEECEFSTALLPRYIPVLNWFTVVFCSLKRPLYWVPYSLRLKQTSSTSCCLLMNVFQAQIDLWSWLLLNVFQRHNTTDNFRQWCCDVTLWHWISCQQLQVINFLKCSVLSMLKNRGDRAIFTR